jgi:hypothetical protein
MVIMEVTQVQQLQEQQQQEQETSIESTTVLAALREFLGSPSLRESAGTTLWDMAAGPKVARIMTDQGKVG